MATAPISYGNDYAAEQSQIERARQYAAIMQQQSMEGSPTQVVNGWAVPNGKAVGFSKAIQGLMGGVSSYLADKKQNDLAAKQKTDLTNTLTDAQKAYMGTPESSAPPQIPLDDQGNQMPNVSTPAVPGDPMKYANILMQNPQTMQMGMQAAQQAMQQQKWAQALGLNTASGAPGASGASGGASPSSAPIAGGVPAGAGSVLAASGITPQEAQASLLADPTGKQLSEKILAARAESQKPVVNRGFGLGTMVNGKYVPDAASTQQALGMETGKADIAAGHKVVGIPQPDGSVRYMTEQQQISQTQPPQNQLPQPMGAPPINPQLAGLPPQIASAIQNDMQRSGTPNANFRMGPTDAPAGTPVAPQNIQSGQIGPQAGAMPPSAPMNMPPQVPQRPPQMPPQMPAQPMPAPGVATPSALPGFSAGQSTLDKSMAEKQGETLATQEAQINHDADSALQKIAQNNKMVDLIPQITTGPAAKQVTTVKMLAQNIGIDIGDPAPNQEFEKYAIKGALEGAKQIYGARLTNQDVMSQIASNPGTTMAQKALYQLIKYDNIQQQRLMDKQSAYFQEFPKTGLPKNQFGMWFNQTHPFMGLSAPQTGQAAEQSAPAQSAPTAPAMPTGVKRFNPATGKIE